MKKTLTLILLLFTYSIVFAQQPALTSEDSLTRNLSLASTTIGGYGNAFYQRNANLGTARMDLERGVLFFGHKFDNRFSFFSELEIEDAKVTGGESGGEVSFEQAYIKYNLNANQYLVAGLFIPRLGILNENHLPNTFNGNERNYVETFIIPATWRELGIGFYGSLNRLPINYSVALVNGLNSGAFQHGIGLVDGRFEGRNATANNMAVTASLQYYVGDFKAQVSGYYGGTIGLSKRKADSLSINSGIFAIPVALGEADVQYAHNGLSVKVLGTIVSMPDASDINRVFNNNTPQTEYGAYAEVGYDLLYQRNRQQKPQLIFFVRDEKLNLNASIPSNGFIDGTLDQNYIVSGFTFLPMRNIALKADVRLVHTGKQNPNLIINPNPAALPYQQNNNLVNVGIAFSF